MKSKGRAKLPLKGEAEGHSDSAVSITQLLNVSPVLPGESAELYRSSLQGLIQELEAKTVLQVYLAEKIHECLWWMRRYEQQKRLILIHEMVSLAAPDRMFDLDDRRTQLLNSLLNGQVGPEASKMISDQGFTAESLLQKAFEKKKLELASLNDQIALQAKVLAGFQASYEVAFNRKFNAERLRLQNQLISRDLDAIDMKQ